MRLVSTLLWIVLFVVLLVFSIENTRNVDLRLFGQVVTSPLVLLLLVFFAIGVVVGLLASVPSWFRGRREITRLTRELEAANRGNGNGAAASASASLVPGASVPRAVVADAPLVEPAQR